MTTYRYMTAAEWGMTWARPPQAEQHPDPEAYVHHAGGAEWMHDDAVTVFRQLNNYAQQGKGYSAVDYDILVHYSRSQDVVTIAGARQEWMSAATRDRNEQGEAICLCADTDEREPLPVEVEGLALAVVYGIEKGWIARNATILGHRDNPAHPGATACPGKFLYAELPAIRRRVAELLNPQKVTMWNQPRTVTNGVVSAPPTAEVLAGRFDTWAAIACVKFVQERLGLPVTGVWDQAFGEAFNEAFGYKP